MFNSRMLGWLMVAVVGLLLSGCGCCPKRMHGCNNCMMGHQQMMAAAPQGDEAVRQDVLYTCACGPQCQCNTVSTAPGNCRCGQSLAWGHVVKVEGSDALLCACGDGCKCAIDAADPTKCACGKPLKRVSLKGSGISFCNCGGSCTCNTVAAQPGACRCGMPLKTVQ